MNERTKQLVAYLAKNHPNSTVTVLVKLSYLVDLVSIKRGLGKISDFNYVRYYYGPYDQQINLCLQNLIELGILIPKVQYTTTADYTIYEYIENQESNFTELTEESLSIINELLEKVKGYGAKGLTDIAYKTKPMLKIGATLGGNEHFNELLDLNAQ